jgi:NADH-quinone oxidoreductase subunit L
MGGLRKLMPVTHISFLVACLAIAGVPFFSGFYSKEEILLAAYHANKLVYGVALFTAGLTAVYMFRLYYNIYWSIPTPFEKARGEVIAHHHGEGSWAMKLPLIILAILAFGAGYFPFAHFVTSDGVALQTHTDWAFSAAPILFALMGIGLATMMYKKANAKPQAVATMFGGFYQTARKKFYIDELYLFITQKIIFNAIGKPAAWFDKNIVDGFMNLLAKITAKISELIKGFQSGKVQNYALYFFSGVLVLAIVFVYWWK